jgi:hypothetical protein
MCESLNTALMESAYLSSCEIKNAGFLLILCQQNLLNSHQRNIINFYIRLHVLRETNKHHVTKVALNKNSTVHWSVAFFNEDLPNTQPRSQSDHSVMLVTSVSLSRQSSRTPWMGNETIVGPIGYHHSTTQHRTDKHPMPRAGFEPDTRLFERLWTAIQQRGRICSLLTSQLLKSRDW